MGFDVTFHPVALSDLQHFVFDVLDDPRVLDDRMRDLTTKSDVRAAVREMFEETLKAVASEDDEADEDELDDEDDVGPANEAIRFLAATVAGCLHPYWYARNAGLSFVQDAEIASLFQSFNKLGHGPIQSIDDPDGPWITGNFTATGFMSPASVVSLHRRIKAGDAKLLAALGTDATESLRKALDYAVARQLGLIEATDVYTALGSISDPANLRDFPKSLEQKQADSPRRGPIECPACGLLNQAGSTRCDCGYLL